MTVPPAGGRLSDEELVGLASLLARFATHDLDQFEHWQLATPYGAVYINMARRPEAGVPAERYTTIWPPPAHLSPGDDRAV